jgi:coenzyme F420-reducing hydrogenase delta subunit
MEGECHFLEGNIRAKKRVNFTKKLLEEVKIEPERIKMFNMGASDAQEFVQAANEMTELARKLGPSPIRKAKEKSS